MKRKMGILWMAMLAVLAVLTGMASASAEVDALPIRAGQTVTVQASREYVYYMFEPTKTAYYEGCFKSSPKCFIFKRSQITWSVAFSIRYVSAQIEDTRLNDRGHSAWISFIS